MSGAECDLERDGSLTAAAGVSDRVRERPREGDPGEDAIPEWRSC